MVAFQIPKGLPYTYDLYSGLPAPAVIFQEPLLGELFGAGFTKSPKCKVRARSLPMTYTDMFSKHYELRFPRLVKLYRPSERSWSEGVILENLHKIAREAIGRDRSSKSIDDWTKEMWGQQASPGIKCDQHRKRRVSDWIEKLETVDNVKTKKRRLSEPAPRARSPLKDHCVSNQGRMTLSNKVLGPKINLVSSIPTPPASNPQNLAPHTSRNRTELKTPPASPTQGAGFNINSPLGNLRSPTVHSPLRERALFASMSIPLFHIAKARSPQRVSPRANDKRHETDASFLVNKFIYLARPSNAPRPKGQASTRELLSGATRLHSLESILIGCKWAAPSIGSPITTYSRPGVIFVDQSTPEGQEWGKHCMKVLEEETTIAPATRHPIWVFEMTALNLDMFRQIDADSEALALRKFN